MHRTASYKCRRCFIYRAWTDGHSGVKSELNRLSGSTRPIVAQYASAVPITNHGGKSDKRRVFPDGVGLVR